jgi:hypothetical protein
MYYLQVVQERARHMLSSSSVSSAAGDGGRADEPALSEARRTIKEQEQVSHKHTSL